MISGWLRWPQVPHFALVLSSALERWPWPQRGRWKDHLGPERSWHPLKACSKFGLESSGVQHPPCRLILRMVAVAPTSSFALVLSSALERWPWPMRGKWRDHLVPGRSWHPLKDGSKLVSEWSGVHPLCCRLTAPWPQWPHVPHFGWFSAARWSAGHGQ